MILQKSGWSEPKDGKAPKKYYEITKKAGETFVSKGALDFV